MQRIRTALLPWSLLLEADPHAPHVETYLDSSDWFGFYDGETLIGVAALLRRDAQTVELMNIAIAESRRRRGAGTQFMRALLGAARRMGAQRVEVGTGNSSLTELAFYQRTGFRIEAVERDHFVRAYPRPIVENGIPCRDRVVLAIRLAESAPRGGRGRRVRCRARPPRRN